MAQQVRLVGIDLSTDNAKTGIVAIDLDGHEVTLRTKEELASNGDLGDGGVASDQGICHLLAPSAAPVYVGIDAPFGWPQPFVNALGEWSAPNDPCWPEEADPADAALDLMRYRTTDLFVKHMGRQVQNADKRDPKRPTRPWPVGISVSSDKLSATSRRCARLLSAMHWTSADHRTGRIDPVIEVYPAAALAQWDLPSKGYKASDHAEDKRLEIIGGIRGQVASAGHPTGAALSKAIEDHADAFTSGEYADDALDALVCALVGWAWRVGATYKSDGRECQEFLADLGATGHIDEEGWIHHPREDLAAIINTHPA